MYFSWPRAAFSESLLQLLHRKKRDTSALHMLNDVAISIILYSGFTTTHAHLRAVACQSLFSLVTNPTLMHWSNALHTNKPCLSGLQSKLLMGWLDRLRCDMRCMLPATPSSLPSWSWHNSRSRSSRGLYLTCPKNPHAGCECYFLSAPAGAAALGSTCMRY